MKNGKYLWASHRKYPLGWIIGPHHPVIHQQQLSNSPFSKPGKIVKIEELSDADKKQF